MAVGAAGGGAIGGGAAVVAYVAAQIIGKHVFGVGKINHEDRASMKMYQAAHGSGMNKGARAAGYSGKNEALAQPYLWMTKAGRDYRQGVRSGAITPDKPWTNEQYQSAYDKHLRNIQTQGAYEQYPDRQERAARDLATKEMQRSQRDVAKYQTPDYRPTEWQAWAGGMLDAGYKMQNIYDATSYYLSEKGRDTATNALQREARGEDYWTSAKADVHAGTLLTQEQRDAKWKSVQEDARMAELPWNTKGFKEVYQKQYGHMKQYKPSQMSHDTLHKQGKIAKRGWYDRHPEAGTYEQALAKATGVPEKESFGSGIKAGREPYLGKGGRRANVMWAPETRENIWGGVVGGGGWKDPYADVESSQAAGGTGGLGAKSSIQMNPATAQTKKLRLGIGQIGTGDGQEEMDFGESG
jgi:hypothetical protein